MKTRLFFIPTVAGLVFSFLFTLSVQASDGPKCAFVSKSAGNPYYLTMEKGFKEVIKNAGGEAIICDPLHPYADDQLNILDSLIVQEVDAIAVSANDRDRLTECLSSAADAGIKIITVDSDTDPSARILFCNQAGTEIIAETLLDSILSISGGEGTFAIVSTTPFATNQNTWIDAMKQMLETDNTYEKLELVDIVYGEDDEAVSKEKTLELLEKYPNLKAICAPTAAGIPGVAAAVLEEGSAVKVTGLGMPSQMAEYVGEDLPCPCVFLWNPENLGKLAAYTCLALVNGEISGDIGDQVSVSDLPEESYDIKVSSDINGNEILMDELIPFTPDNIETWADLF